MIEEGAAPAIIALAASSHNRHLRSQCVEALCKLAVVPGSEAQIIAEVRARYGKYTRTGHRRRMEPEAYMKKTRVLSVEVLCRELR